MGLLMAGARVAVGSAIALSAFAWWAGITTQPFRLAVVYAAFCGFYLVGSRYFAQYFLVRRSADNSNVIVYGAGESGARVAQAMHGDSAFKPVAFIDDDKAMHGKQLFGLRIHGREKLEYLIDKYNVARVLLAMPSASRRHRQDIISSLESLQVHVQTVPDYTDLITGKARVDDIREVDVEDLLTRQQVTPDDSLMQVTSLGKTVLVTGAGGSIGSELCRQILRVGPKRLVLFEISEVALYSIDIELRVLVKKIDLDCEIVPLLGSVQDERRMREVMERFGVDAVYHAAAYKHVPMVEHNMVEGIHNNIFGTWHTAQAAEDAGVETFVLVSTDKAVSPANVMGATKRMAELVLQGLHDRGSKTRFCMVRFGNVLASSGSVVPLFREQIRRGGPVTVTHPEIIRYFMTIPEAAQLVIQAGSMGKGGDVFVLDMGRPVRIEDLARRMIHLMGLTVRDEEDPDGDIAIEYMGLRPAEKLYEELLIGNNVMGTEHPMIMRAMEQNLSWQVVEACLDQLWKAVADFDCERVRELLLENVEGYTPSSGIEDSVWRANHPELAAKAASAKVTELDSRRTG